MQYAVVDIETTGGSNKITEIAIFVYDDEQKAIVDEFTSLVNPECNIPAFITNLTGINNDMVASAPRFFEIAKDVYNMTKDRVFVAHSVGFDYNIIRSEFKELGADFRRKKACTVRLSRKIFPGLRSYSLGNLCDSLGIPITDRHRAAGDAKATTTLLELLLDNDEHDHINNTIKKRNKEGSLPPNLPRETYDNLPDQTGVYFMHNQEGKVIYVGKAKEIKSRINGHFADNSVRKLKFKNQIHDISYQVTGSELLALLVEAVEIKNHFPEFNHAQKYTGSGYSLYQYEDQKGVIRLDIVKRKKFVNKGIATFSNTTRAREFLQQLVRDYELCLKMTGLQTLQGACFDHQLGLCNGICVGKENVEEYNSRVRSAIEQFSLQLGTYAVWLKGRHRDEKSFIFIENGTYKGYGYVDSHSQINSLEDIIDILVPQKHNVDIQHILNSHLQRISPSKITQFETGDNKTALESV